MSKSNANPDPDRQAQRTYAVVWLANFLAAIGMMSFIPFFPSYLKHLGVEADLVPIWAGACVGAAPLAAALMSPIWGALGDRYGRKPMVLRALVGIVIFVGAMSLATTPLQLFALRIGQGVFSGFLPPSVTLVTLSFPAGRQGRIAGGLQAAMAGGTIIGPLFGSFFRSTFSPNLLFLATASLCAMAALLVLLFTREPEGEDAASGGSLDGPGGAAVLVDVFRRLGSMLKKPRMGPALLFLFAAQFGMGATNPQLELFVQQLHPAWTQAQVTTHTAWLFSIMAVSAVLTMPQWGRIGDERGHGRVLIVSALVAGLSMFVSGAAPVFLVLLLGRLVLGLFGSGFAPAAFGIVAGVTPRSEQGAANGAVFSARALAMAISSMVGGALVSVIGMRGLFHAAGALLCLLAIFGFKRMWRPATPVQ
ncbi:MAG: MFS transporter [Planctomycetota bacterium]|nr:MFS transporter [Planctomycetota bacterium]